MVPARPFFIGSPGCVRSSAWICVFSSTQNTCAYRLCHPNVVPVETAEPSDWCDAPDCLRGAMERRILVECKVRAHPIVVGGVIRQHMPEVPFPQYHDMVEALASDRANQPFNMTVLPWRTWSDWPVANAHGLQATGDRGAIRGVAVSDEVARRLIPWKRFGALPGDPLCGWIVCDIGAVGPSALQPQ